jgi:hypothetical protein
VVLFKIPNEIFLERMRKTRKKIVVRTAGLRVEI